MCKDIIERIFAQFIHTDVIYVCKEWYRIIKRIVKKHKIYGVKYMTTTRLLGLNLLDYVAFCNNYAALTEVPTLSLRGPCRLPWYKFIECRDVVIQLCPNPPAGEKDYFESTFMSFEPFRHYIHTYYVQIKEIWNRFNEPHKYNESLSQVCTYVWNKITMHPRIHNLMYAEYYYICRQKWRSA